jgi:hypothetical protein
MYPRPVPAAAFALKTLAAHCGRTPLDLTIKYGHASCKAALRAPGAPE